MTQIRDVIPVVGRSGFFNRDLAAVKAGARADGFAYTGTPLSPGFQKIVQPGTAISVMLLLDDRDYVANLRHGATFRPN